LSKIKKVAADTDDDDDDGGGVDDDFRHKNLPERLTNEKIKGRERRISFFSSAGANTIKLNRIVTYYCNS